MFIQIIETICEGIQSFFESLSSAIKAECTSFVVSAILTAFIPMAFDLGTQYGLLLLVLAIGFFIKSTLATYENLLIANILQIIATMVAWCIFHSYTSLITITIIAIFDFAIYFINNER